MQKVIRILGTREARAARVCFENSAEKMALELVASVMARRPLQGRWQRAKAQRCLGARRPSFMPVDKDGPKGLANPVVIL